jgi:hypothetical protein
MINSVQNQFKALPSAAPQEFRFLKEKPRAHLRNCRDLGNFANDETLD